MKPTSGIRSFARIGAWVVAIVVALGYYGHVKAQSGVGSVVIPLRPLAPLSSVPIPPVFGVEGIVADKQSAIQLGKALFWDMQAGSDDIQACASCHFNAGADSRINNDINPGQSGGDNTFQVGNPLNGVIGPNNSYHAGSADAGFGGYHDGDFPFRKVSDVNNRFSVTSDVNDVSGSAGIFPLQIVGVTVGTVGGDGTIQPSNPSNGNAGGDAHDAGDDGDNGGGDAGFTRTPHSVGNPNKGKPVVGTGKGSGSSNGGGSATTTGSSSTIGTASGDTSSVEQTTSVVDPVFSYPDPNDSTKSINTRRTTGRNTPSVVNAVFNFRNFWDGRAMNDCNGANPFGGRDASNHLVVMKDDGTLAPSLMSMKNSALCSQSLGPILSSTEMSANGRDFKQVGKKMLARVPLAKQMVDPTDSVLGLLSNAPKAGLNTTYSALIQKAFLPEWWQYTQDLCVASDGSTAATVTPGKGSCPANTLEYSEMQINFSLFWGVAIQMYESTLVADHTPLDMYLEQQQGYTLVGDNVKNQYTMQLQPNVVPYTISVIGLNPTLDASDQDTYSFDDGQGHIGGVGVNSGSINYATGLLTIYFGEPPVSQVPVQINYSIGSTPMTAGQLRGLNIFQTKGECVVCHGGPELSNAAVGTVANEPIERMIMEDDSARVYDTGFYHIGIRPSAEDAGLAGNDGVANLPLSNAEYLREHVCNGGFETVVVPGRRGDGISTSPLNCSDDIARSGFFKAPQLRNVALTAPYFHNGGQLTLEQVVEFYNRGGDFNTVAEVKNMDPDIEILGLTLQDKQDLVEFLRYALTDPRTATQSAPFDHPQLTVANGHPQGANGYPVMNDPAHPGQATNQFMQVPATGAKGGAALPTFLDNLLGVKSAKAN
ncbi:MAG TPA: cytochrome c peroxidase [Candidatus Angelobacter sp.]|nr:cytochrome c peroxidase [Candidatus Angelobacter sp.]